MSRTEKLSNSKIRMLRSRTLDTHEFRRVQDFYKKNRYDSKISPADRFLVIENECEILGALRVCSEEGVFVLRGMVVAEQFRRRGIGSKLLDYFAEFTGNKGCYCISHRYLISFYDRIGFEELDPKEAPEFLNTRLQFYQTELRLDEVLLYKPSIR